MAENQLFIRLDLSNGKQIGPGKIALLEAIQAEGSILAASRHFGMSYRHAWLLVRELNETLRKPVVATTRNRGGGAELTPVGEQMLRSTAELKARVHFNATGVTRNRQTHSPKEGTRS